MVGEKQTGLYGGERRSSTRSVILSDVSVMVVAISPSRDLCIDVVPLSQKLC